MTFTSYGYDGSVNEANWAKMSTYFGATYAIGDAPDFRVTPKLGVDRTVTIAAGGAWGYGVRDVSNSTVDIAIPAPASGTVWHLIVLRRDWSTNTTSVQRIEGGTQILTLPTRNMNPGLLDDQPIAAVSVTAGSTAITSVKDLRCWGAAGAYVASDALVLQYLMGVGSRVRISDREYLRRVNAAGTAAEWVWTSAFKLIAQPTQPPVEAGAIWLETSV